MAFPSCPALNLCGYPSVRSEQASRAADSGVGLAEFRPGRGLICIGGKGFARFMRQGTLRWSMVLMRLSWKVPRVETVRVSLVVTAPST